MDYWDKFKKDKGIKDLSKMGLANIIGSAISAIFWFYLAPILGTESYGQIGYFISIASIAGVISLFGAGRVLLVYRPKGVEIQGAIFTIAIISSVICAIVLFFLFNQIGISVFVVGYVIFGLITGDVLGLKLYQKYFNYSVGQKILFLILSIGLYYTIGTEGIILGFGLSYIPYAYIAFKIFRDSKIDFKILREKIGFVSNSYVTMLAGIFSSHTDRLILGSLFGFTLLGNYQLSIQVLTVLTILPSMVFQYILPRESSGLKNNKLKKITIVISIIIVILVVILSPIGIPWLFPQFEESIIILQIGIFSLIPKTIVLMQTSKFLSVENSKDVLISTGTYLLLQISGILILGEIFGIYGAAIALVLGGTGQAIYLTIITHRLEKKKLILIKILIFH